MQKIGQSTIRQQTKVTETNAYFDDIHTHIIRELKKANSDITIAVTWLTDNEIFQTLCRKAKSGTTVRLALLDDDVNRKKSNIQFQQFIDAGGELFWIPVNDSNGIMHLKFCVIDQRNVITGSYNWTQLARVNHENIVVVSNATDFAMQYLDSFNELLDQYNYTVKISSKSNEAIKRRVAMIAFMIQQGDPDDSRLIELFLKYRDLTTKTLNRFYRWDMELLTQLPETWNWWELSRNTLMHWDSALIERFENKWHWQALSSNESLPWNATLIERYKERWDWAWLSSNKALPWKVELIERYKDRWDWDKLSSNKDLPWDAELIERYKYHWDWERLSCNEALPWSVSLLEFYQVEFLRAGEGAVLFWTTNILQFFQPMSRETVLEICRQIRGKPPE
jgi:phosphatidylserine/phosphatidylglycerophosphate/cardiolipin synthase-like enzyme